MIFYVTIPVKPYVKRFIENNYGDPVCFRKFPREYELFKRMLKRPSKNYETMYRRKLKYQTENIKIVVSEHDVVHYGYELTKTDIISFGKYFERHAKLLMRTVVGMYVSFGIPLEKAIMLFQEKYSMEEEYWQFDSIKKDFYRMRFKNDLNLNQYAYEHLEKLIRINMYNAGILTSKEGNNG